MPVLASLKRKLIMPLLKVKSLWSLLVTPVFSIRVRARVGVLMLLVLVAFTGIAYNLVEPSQTAAATNNVINFQARLETNSGAIVPDGNYNVEFKLYSASSGGTALWTEDYLNSASQGITVANGYLTANLGSVTAFPSTINWDQQLWLTMNIGGTTTGTPSYDGEMSPRLQLTALPYAFRAGKLADPANSGSLLGWNTQSGAHNLYLPNENGTLCSTGSVCSGYAASSGSGSYIQNGTGVQTGANFNIDGNGTIGGTLQAATVNATSAIQLGGANINTGGTLSNVAYLNQANLFTNTNEVKATSTTAFQIQNSGATSNLLVADTSNSVIGIGEVPTSGNGILQLHGALTLDGGYAGTVNFTTPVGSHVPTAIDIPLYDPGAFGQILAFGLPSGADYRSRAISVFDDRSTTDNQPAIGLFNSNETNILGLSWDGGVTTGYLKTLSGGAIGFRSGATTLLGLDSVGNATLTGDLQVQGGDITTNQTTFNLLNTTPTTLNIGGAAGSGGINLAGGSGSTGCTIDGSSGALTCSGTLTVGTNTSLSSTTLTIGGNAVCTSSGCTASGSGVTTVGTIDTGGTPVANGAVISGSTIYLQSATGSYPGLVNTTTQTLAGAKTFSSLLTGSAGLTVTGAAVNLNASSNNATNINTGTSTGAVGIGNSAAGAVTIASGAASSFVTNAGNLTLQAGSGTVSLGSSSTLTNTGALTITGGSTLALQSTSTSAVSLDSGTTGAINIGTSAANKTISIGNTTSSGATQTINLGYDASAGSLNTIVSNINIGTASNSNATTTIQAGYSNGSIQIGSLNSGATQTINVGTNTASTQTVTLGSKAATSSTTTIQGGSGSSAILVQAANSGTITIGNQGASSANTINIGAVSAVANADTISIGTSTGAAQTVTVGSTSTTSTTNIQGGTSGSINIGATGASTNASTVHIADQTNGSGTQMVSIGSTNGSSTVLIQAGSPGAGAGVGIVSGSGPIQIGTNGTAHTVTIGTTTGAGSVVLQGGTGGITIGNDGVANTIQIGTTTGAVAQTVNIGNNATASSTTSVNIGNLLGTSTTTIQGGTGGIKLTPSGSSNTGVLVMPGTNSTAAFQVQKAASGGAVLDVDTTNGYVGVGTATPSGTLTVNSTGATNTSGIVILGQGNSGTDTLNLYEDNNSARIDSQNSQLNINYSNGQTVAIGGGGTSTDAFHVQDASGNNVIQADTQNLHLNVTGQLNAGTAYGNRLFADGFESGNLGFWSDTTGSVSVSTAFAHNGKYSAKVIDGSSNAYTIAEGFTSANTVYVRDWVYFSAQSSANADILSLFDTTTSNEFQLMRTSAGKLAIWRSIGNSTVTASTGNLTTVGWHEVEMEVTIGTSGNSQAWLDGTQVINSTSQNNGSTPISTLLLGDDDTTNNATVYHDDIAVDTASLAVVSNSANVDENLHVGGSSSFANNVVINAASDTALEVQDAAGDGMNTGHNGLSFSTNTGDLYLWGSGSRITFGDYSSGDQTAFVGEYNGDTDQLQLNGEQGIEFTAGSYSSPVLVGYINNSGVLDVSSGFMVSGTAGVTSTTCTTGQHLQVRKVTGGIVTTSGGCQTGADYAENYVSSEVLSPGEVVSVDHNNPSQIIESTSADQSDLVGVISTQPGDVIGGPDGYPVALVGHVPVKVSLEGGAIEPGDKLTSSSTPGVAMKATGPGEIIGTALTSYDGSQSSATVDVFMGVGYWGGPSQSSYLQNGGDASLGNLTVNGLSTVNDVQASGTITASNVVASTATVQDMTSTNSTTDSLSVGGNANVGNLVANGTITTNDLTVSGSTTVADLTATSISAASASIGDITVSGAVNTGDLTVTGSATLATLHVTGDTTISGDLTIGGHLITSGQAPTVKVESAAGDNATCTIDGNDTGGKITINTGATNLADGAQCTLTFNKAFTQATNPVISPRNKDSAQVQSFVDSAASKLIVEFAQAPTASTTYVFNYFNTQ